MILKISAPHLLRYIANRHGPPLKPIRLIALLGILSIPLAAQSYELMAVWSEVRVDAYGPFESSRGVDGVGIGAAIQMQDYPSVFLRGHLMPTATANGLQYQALSLGTEFRLEDPDWYWGATLGVDARVERFQQQAGQMVLWSPTPHQVQFDGFNKAVVRPIATCSVQYPGILLYIPLAKVVGPLQPITRIQAEWAPLRPNASGAAGEFLQHLQPLQYSVQVGFRFR